MHVCTGIYMHGASLGRGMLEGGGCSWVVYLGRANYVYHSGGSDNTHSLCV